MQNNFFKKLKEKTGRHQTLIQNFSYLSALQPLNMLLPLVTYPYLIRVLGIETYGLVVFAQAVIGYLVVLVNFGFNITATREVSIHRNEPPKLNEIVSSIFLIKGMLLLVAFLILSILLFILPQTKGYHALFYLTMWMCLYEVLFPTWYFQGIEKMKYITYLTFISRLVFLVLIFVMVNTKEDYLKVPVINGIGALIAGVFSLVLLRKDLIKFKIPNFQTLFWYFKNSYVMALAYASNTFKSNFNLVVIKFLFSFSEVAYFDLALKITNIGNTFLDLVSQTIFPKMSREKNTVFLKKVINLTLVISFLFVIFIQIFSVPIIEILGGKEMYPTNLLLKILVCSVPLSVAGGLLGRNCLVVHGYNKKVLLSMLYAGFVYLGLLGLYYVINIQISITVIVLILVTSITFETLYRYYVCKSKKIL